MKEIFIIRGNSHDKIIAGEDVYDSYLGMFVNGELVYSTEHVNTDPTRDSQSKSGLLSPGKYYGIGRDKKYGEKAILLFNTETNIEKIKGLEDLNEENVCLNSLKENDNANGKYKMSWVEIHMGGYKQDYSEGCITIYPKDWEVLKTNILINELYEIHLT